MYVYMICRVIIKDQLEGTAERPRSSIMVIDGGCILWEVEWKIGATYAQFGDNVARKIKSMSAAMIVLIFDGYAPSAKDLEHASRQKYSCARQLVSKDKKILVNRNRFFSNGPNKECLVAFLRTWLNASDILQGSAVTLIIKKSKKDTDTLTVKSVKEESEKTNQPVVVHGTDTDILMLLLFHGHMNTNLFSNNINMSNVSRRKTDIFSGLLLLWGGYGQFSLWQGQIYNTQAVFHQPRSQRYRRSRILEPFVKTR